MAAHEQSRISQAYHVARFTLVLIDDLYFGGDEYRLHAFGSSVDKTRFSHTVLTLMKENPALGTQYGSMREIYRQSGIRLIDLGQKPISPAGRRDTNILMRICEAWKKIEKLTAIIVDERVDILDVHLAPANPISAIAALKTGRPFTVTLYQINRKRSVKLWLTGQFALGCATALITDSQVQAREFRAWLVRGRPIRVFPRHSDSPSNRNP